MTEGKKENVGVTLSIFVLGNRTVINAGGWELNFPWLLRTWTPATFIGKQKKNRTKRNP